MREIKNEKEKVKGWSMKKRKIKVENKGREYIGYVGL